MVKLSTDLIAAETRAMADFAIVALSVCSAAVTRMSKRALRPRDEANLHRRRARRDKQRYSTYVKRADDASCIRLWGRETELRPLGRAAGGNRGCLDDQPQRVWMLAERIN